MTSHILAPMPVHPQRRRGLQLATSPDFFDNLNATLTAAAAAAAAGGLAGSSSPSSPSSSTSYRSHAHALLQDEYTVPAPPPPTPIGFRGDHSWPTATTTAKTTTASA